MSNTAERINKAISEQLAIPLEDVTPEKFLVADLLADSLDSVELLIDLESEFGINIDDDDWERATTVQAVIDLVTRLAKHDIQATPKESI